MAEQPTCATCRFWDREVEEEGKFCRRYAPRPVVDRKGPWGTARVLFPVTCDMDWCGEHQPAPIGTAPTLQTRCAELEAEVARLRTLLAVAC